MFSLFNQSSPWKKGLQIFNLLVLTTATYNLFSDPDTELSQSGLQILVHATNVLALRENSNLITDVMTIGLNIFSLGAIYGQSTSKDFAAPLLNTMMVVAHLLTSGTIVSQNPPDPLNRYPSISMS